MKVSVCIFNKLMFAWLALSTTVSLADGAGVLIYSENNNQQLVLLADHKKDTQVKRGWSTLGGTVKDNETHLAAAVREVFEESNGILKSDELKALIDPEIKTQTPGFTIYFAKIDYVPASNFAQKPQDAQSQGFAERGPYTWVPWSEIERAASVFETAKAENRDLKIKVKAQYLPTIRQTDWYFSAFLSTVKQITNTHNGPLKTTLCTKVD